MKGALDKALGSRELFGAPVLIVANKQDVAGAETSTELASHLGISSVDTRPCKVQDCCAHEGTGMAEGLQWLVQACRDSSRTYMRSAVELVWVTSDSAAPSLPVALGCIYGWPFIMARGWEQCVRLSSAG